MRGFEKFILCLFSIIMIILSVFIILVSTSMIQVGDLYTVVVKFLIAHKLWVLIVGGIVSLLGLVGLFSSSDSSDDSKSGLAIKNDAGTVFLNRDTFESMIMSVARNYPELVSPKVDVTIAEDGVKANIYGFYQAGVQEILSFSAVGGINLNYKNGDLVLTDDAIDNTDRKSVV